MVRLIRSKEAMIASVLLATTAGVIWYSRRAPQFDPVVVNTRFEYECAHCQRGFALTMLVETSMMRKRGGVTCPRCSRVQDPDLVRKEAGIFARTDQNADTEQRPEISTGLKMLEHRREK